MLYPIGLGHHAARSTPCSGLVAITAGTGYAGMVRRIDPYPYSMMAMSQISCVAEGRKPRGTFVCVFTFANVAFCDWAPRHGNRRRLEP